MTPAKAESVISRANDQAVWPWQAEPYKLRSLLEMNILESHRIAYIAKYLGETTEKARSKIDDNKPLDDSDTATLKHAVEGIRDELEGLGLESPLDQAIRISQRLEKQPQPSVEQDVAALVELHNRFYDALRRTLCFILPSDRAVFYRNSQLFGVAVAERFAAATLDIEEAGKCLALQRGTATVFHLMRVMEVGLTAIAAELGIPYAPSWESYLRQIKTQVEVDWSKKSADWKKRESFFKDVLAHLEAVKLAWRNPTMHIVNHYTPETAEQVYNAVKGFMQHLAEKLPTRTPVKRKRKRGSSASGVA